MCVYDRWRLVATLSLLDSWASPAIKQRTNCLLVLFHPAPGTKQATSSAEKHSKTTDFPQTCTINEEQFPVPSPARNEKQKRGTLIVHHRRWFASNGQRAHSVVCIETSINGGSTTEKWHSKHSRNKDTDTYTTAATVPVMQPRMCPSSCCICYRNIEKPTTSNPKEKRKEGKNTNRHSAHRTSR